MTGADLIRRMAEGDRDAFRQLYDRHAGEVYPLILRIVGNPSDAADVVQGVFWDAWQNAASHDPAGGTVEAWLVLAARTRAIDRLRSGRRGEDGAADRGEAPAGIATTPPARPERPEVAGALGRLPEVQREVLTLAYYAGLTQTQIAERLGQPLARVQARMYEALERVREVFGTP